MVTIGARYSTWWGEIKECIWLLARLQHDPNLRQPQLAGPPPRRQVISCRPPIFDPAAEGGDWHLVGHTSIPSGAPLIVDPAYPGDELPIFERAARAALAEAGHPPFGDDFCIPPELARAVAVRIPDPETRLSVHALLDSAYPPRILIRGLWLPFDSAAERIEINLDDDQWHELGSFTVDGGRVALFDGGLAATNRKDVNEQIDNVISQDMYRFARLIEAQIGTSDSGDWPADDAERPVLARGVLGSHAFELAVEGKAIIVSSTGYGDGLYQVFAYLPKGGDARRCRGWPCKGPQVSCSLSRGAARGSCVWACARDDRQ